MKETAKVTKNKRGLQQTLFLGTLLLMLVFSGKAVAQKDSLIKDEPEAKEESSLISPSLEFISVQNGDNTIDLKAALKAKVKGTVIKLPLLKVTFIQVIDDTEKELGFVITDGIGKAVYHIKATDSLKPDKEGKFYFKAVFAGNKQMESAEGEVTIRRARLEITPVKEDSALSVQVKLVDAITEKPVAETVVGVYVHRFFNPLKIGEGTTDENGEASIEIPDNLPGDAKGNLTLMAMLQENETYGNLQTTVDQKWGIPVSDKLKELPRALWSAHPPIWMLITFIILVATVWGHYLVIIIQLFRLRKEEPEPNSPNVEHLS